MSQSIQEEVERVIRSRFEFLEDAGFEISRAGPGVVEWKAGDRRIAVSRDWRDGWIVLSFETPTGAFGLHHALTQLDASEKLPEHGWQARELETVRSFVDDLAGVLEDISDDFLENSSLWQRAAEQANSDAFDSFRAAQARQLRSRAEAAWHAKNWGKVRETYGELRDSGEELNPSEERRLEIAERWSNRTA